jgi:hypothetical protein
MGAHAGVGLLTLVVADETCRVYLDGIVQPFSMEYGAHNFLGRT